MDEVDDDVDISVDAVKGVEGKAAQITQQLLSMCKGIKHDKAKLEKGEKQIQELIRNREKSNTVLRHIEVCVRNIFDAKDGTSGESGMNLQLLKEMDLVQNLNQNATEYNKSLQEQLDLVNDLNSSLSKENKQIKLEIKQTKQKYQSLKAKFRKLKTSSSPSSLVSPSAKFDSLPSSSSNPLRQERETEETGDLEGKGGGTNSDVQVTKKSNAAAIVHSLRAQNTTQRLQIQKLLKETKQLKDLVRTLEEQTQAKGKSNGMFPPIKPKSANSIQYFPGASRLASVARSRSGSAPKSPKSPQQTASSPTAAGYSDFLLQMSGLGDDLL